MSARRLLGALAGLAMLPTAACYHQVVETGRPASETVIDRQWQMSYIGGLVAPAPLNVATECPNGVARVETQHTFLNQLVALVTFGIVTPIRVTVTCAGSGAGAAAPDARKVTGGEDDAAQAAAIERAVEIARESGAAVYVELRAGERVEREEGAAR
jgi:hypothetical protein